MVDKELERLKREITQERLKVKRQSNIAKQINVKKVLKRELFELQNPRKFTLARRLKRGFKIGAKKVGKGLLKQGRLIKEQQERDTKVTKSIQRVRKTKRLPKLTKKRKSSGGASFFAPLDF